MSTKVLLVVAAMSAVLIPALRSADSPKKALAKQAEPTAGQNTYPFYGKVVAVTSRTLTIVRGESTEAVETKFNLNTTTEYINGDKPVSFEAVKVGSWVGGTVKKSPGEGHDSVLKLNVGVKQKATEKGNAKTPAKKKDEPKKKATPKKKSE
ncbi:MAG: hypothetical protein RIS79_3828 [Verrucomicrobiota bacterium]|jgi:hypothetical protein